MRSLLVAVCLCLAALPARADLNPETGTPYKLQIILHFAPHIYMTEVFKAKVAQDTRDSLKAALGELADVEVVDDQKLAKHPEDQKALNDVLERGLQYALDGWKGRAIDGIKRHFVLIDFVQGKYEIAARQHDGTTGLSSPTVRQTQTSDRLLVAREAAMLVYKDFGLVGTVQNLGDGKSANTAVAIKGGALNVPLDRWIQKGDVFAVSEIVGQEGAQRAYRRSWTLLQVAQLPKDGICVCLPLSRYKWPPPGTGGSQGLRCLRIGTTQNKLKMRLVDDKQGNPIPGLSITVSGQGFGSTGEQLSPNNDGMMQTENSYKNVAYVRVSDGAQVLSEIPVEIVDDRTIVCTIKKQYGGERIGQLGIRWSALVRRLDDDRLAVDQLWNELQKEGAMTPKQWVQRANQGLTHLQQELLGLHAERDQLEKERGELAKDPKITFTDLFDFATADQILHGLEDRRDSLAKSIKEMNDQIAKGLPELQDKWKLEIKKAEELEKQADYQQALAIYERIVTEGSKDPSLLKKLQTLKQAWEPKGEQHRGAREFIYVEWPKCTTARAMKDKLEEAKSAFAVCKEAHDYFTCRKLYLVNEDHAAQLRKEIEVLKGDNEDDRATLDLLKTVAPELVTLSKQVTDFLKTEKTAGPSK
jgi:hypothetical protein